MLKYILLSLCLLFAKNKKETFLELSFGHSLVYASNAERETFIESYDIAIPTSSALFLGEWFLIPELRIINFLNLPLNPEQHLTEEGVLELKKAHPYYGIGPNWVPLSWNIVDRFDVELQSSVLGGLILHKLNDPTPVFLVAERLLISTANGSTMYLGASYTISVAAITLLYGIGHRF